MESEKEIYFNCEKQQIKNAMEDINELVKDIKKNNMYLSDRENLSLQTLNLYINDSTPNCYMRDEIKELEKLDLTVYIGTRRIGKTFQQAVRNEKIIILKKILNKE